MVPPGWMTESAPRHRTPCARGMHVPRPSVQAAKSLWRSALGGLRSSAGTRAGSPALAKGRHLDADPAYRARVRQDLLELRYRVERRGCQPAPTRLLPRSLGVAHDDPLCRRRPFAPGGRSAARAGGPRSLREPSRRGGPPHRRSGPVPHPGCGGHHRAARRAGRHHPCPGTTALMAALTPIVVRCAFIPTASAGLSRQPRTSPVARVPYEGHWQRRRI
jgi:hypothetical protein